MHFIINKAMRLSLLQAGRRQASAKERRQQQTQPKRNRLWLRGLVRLASQHQA